MYWPQCVELMYALSNGTCKSMTILAHLEVSFGFTSKVNLFEVKLQDFYIIESKIICCLQHHQMSFSVIFVWVFLRRKLFCNDT